MRFTSSYQLKIAESLAAKAKVTLATTSPSQLSDFYSIFAGEGNEPPEILDNNKLCALDTEVSLSFDEGFVPDNQYFYIAAQLLERNERYNGELTFDDRNLVIYKQYQYWIRKIRGHRPQVVIFMDMPHMYYEWVIMGLLKRQGIQCIIVEQIMSKYVFMRDINLNIIRIKNGLTFGAALREKKLLTLKNEERPVDKKIRQQGSLLEGAKNLVRACWRLARNLCRAQSAYGHGYFIKRQWGFGLNSLKNQLYREVNFHCKAMIARVLLWMFATKKTQLIRDYIYFPLPSGFENSFHPYVGTYDIETLLDMLARSFPDIKVVLKEHPAQFRFRYHQSFSRPLNFYYKMWLRKDVILLKEQTDQFNLISNARAVLAGYKSSSFYEARFLATDTIVPSIHGIEYIYKDVSLDEIFGTEPACINASIFRGTAADAGKIGNMINRNLAVM